MKRKYLLGAAAVALFGAVGAAQAADVMPIVPVVVTPVVVPPAGPAITITLEKLIGGDWEDENLYLHADHYAEVDVKTARGLGFTFSANLTTYLGPPILPIFPIEGFLELNSRVYMAIRNLEVGVHGEYWTTIPFGDTGFNFGPDFTFESGRLSIEHRTSVLFDGGFDYVDVDTEATFAVSDMLDINLGTFLEFDPAFDDLDVYAGVTLHVGPFSPYGGLWYDVDDGVFGLEAGFDFEKQLGNGPFSLIANGGVAYDFGGDAEFGGHIGIRFTR